MKNKSILLKYYLATLFVIMISFILFAVVFSGISYRYVINDKKSMIFSTSEVAANMASAKSVEGELTDWDLRINISTIAEASGTRILLCDSDGIISSCSDGDAFCEHIGSEIELQELKELILLGSSCKRTGMDGLFNEQSFVSCSSITSPYSDTVIGYAIVSAEVANIRNIWKGVFWIFAVIAIIIMALVLIITWFTAGRQLAPLREMAKAARAFGKGNLSIRVSGYDKNDEIGELGEAFNQMAESLEGAEKRRSEFIANISHELKTPMTTIAGYADGMLDGTIPWENRERYLMIISDETRRLSRLVRKMLDVSRLRDSGEADVKKGRSELCEAVRMAVLSLEGRINAKKLEIDAQIPEEDIIVGCDGDSLTQVIYNILDNAVKFAYPESMLTIRIWKNGTKTYVSIKNKGDCIPSDDIPYIFDRFHKSDKSRSVDKEGVGLGLYIVKSIINACGETITVKSENNETEFVFSMTVQPSNEE